MRSLGVCLLTLGWVVPAAAGPKDLPEARRRLLRGNYSEARALFTRLLDKEQDPAAAVGLSRAWRGEGQYAKARQALQGALKARPAAGELWAELADLHYLRGRWDEAERAARKALQDGRGQFLAHWVLARVHRDRGNLDKSRAALTWLVHAYNSAKDITDPEDLVLIGQATCERARWNKGLSDEIQLALSELYLPVAKKHKDCWQASYLIGALFLEKYNKAKANKAFDRALKINPRAAEVLAARGAMALRGFDGKAAEDNADLALAINPRLVPALRLRADIALLAGDTAAARKFLGKALAVNPWSEKTLGRLAACLYLDHKEAELNELCGEVQKRDPKAGVFYHELADQLDQHKRYDDAERYYLRAIKLRPGLAGPRNGLGLLYMRLGQEEEGREVLEAAFKDDPFNVRVFNTLEVLDHLKPYTTLKTPHFVLRYDPKHDRVLARFVAKYAEDIYAELSNKFGYHPKGPRFLIEVFNRHPMFSARVVALPDLHTVGACTGRMLAMVSPRDESGIVPRPFNWSRVLRHELTHVFNLDQTRFQVPHWLTEGLAVRSEQMPMPPLWTEILMEKVDRGGLLNLDNIHLAFIRPKSPRQWQQAYLQSYLYVEYLTKAHREKAVGALLDAYRDGLDTGAAIRKACGVSKAEFEKGYRAYLRARVKNLRRRPAVKTLEFEDLRAALARDPNNPDLTAQLAWQYLQLRNPKRARELADAALGRKKGQPLASYVKARLLLADKKQAAAVAALEGAVDRNDPDPKVMLLLGGLRFKAKQFREAADAFELGLKAEPYRATWLTLVVRCYRQTGDKAKLIESLERLAPTDADDLETRRELAQLCLKAGRAADAERYAREALEIDVLDAEAQEALEQALRAQHKDDQLRQLRELLGRS
jgi:tetratricopeptide (TPR) repeat protein